MPTAPTFCDNCGRTSDDERAAIKTTGRARPKALCRWCRSARTRAANRRAQRAVPVPAHSTPEAMARDAKIRAGKPESTLSLVTWMVALILLFGAAAFFTCRARSAEAGSRLGPPSFYAEVAEGLVPVSKRPTPAPEPSAPMAWQWVTESGTVSWADERERVPEKYRDGAQHVPLESLLDYERTTIIPR